MRIKFLFIVLLFASSAYAQENNSSISDELKEIWSSDNGIYRDPSNSSILGIGTEEVDVPGGNVQTDAPIDGGLGFLLAAGVGYYANGVRKRRRQKNQNDSEGKESDK